MQNDTDYYHGPLTPISADGEKVNNIEPGYY